METCFLGISMSWVFLGFPNYNLAAASPPYLGCASGFFTQGTSRTSIPNLKTTGQSLVSQWKLLIQMLYGSWLLEISLYRHAFIWCIYLWRMHGVTKDFLCPWYIFLWANIGGCEEEVSICIFMFFSLTEVNFNFFNICSSILLSLSFSGVIWKRAIRFSSSCATFIPLVMFMDRKGLMFTTKVNHSTLKTKYKPSKNQILLPWYYKELLSVTHF